MESRIEIVMIVNDLEQITFIIESYKGISGQFEALARRFEGIRDVCSWIVVIVTN